MMGNRQDSTPQQPSRDAAPLQRVHGRAKVRVRGPRFARRHARGRLGTARISSRHRWRLVTGRFQAPRRRRCR